LRPRYTRSVAASGDGVRKTLQAIRSHIDLQVHEVPTRTAVFDWVIPREWNIRDAYIKNERGEKILDFARSNLHVMSYSVPVRSLRRGWRACGRDMKPRNESCGHSSRCGEARIMDPSAVPNYPLSLQHICFRIGYRFNKCTNGGN
jgi:hypothetical protein